ncbi:MAG TPA: nucleotide exchange factor GrpE [Syntrophomonadaceae bacterium]|nr:nucleotide exchange factor GrpE [Syntrophomonadaceae bacterium]
MDDIPKELESETGEKIVDVEPAGDLVTELQEKLAEAEEEAKKHLDNYLRTLAEMENMRKRSQREREEYLRYATLPVIKKLLPIIDDFERAVNIEYSQDVEGLHKGMEMIFRKLLDLIKAEGVEPIKTMGELFNPEFHQPLLVEESEEAENTILEEMQKGYIMHGRVIRPSLVKVSK